MMNDHQEKMLDRLIKREGGFVDLPEDRGGPTKYGITWRTLKYWRRRTPTREEIENLSIAEAREIYADIYLHRPRIDQIGHPRLQEQMFDMSAHHGPDAAVKMLQRELRATADGIIGPRTLWALRAYTDSEPGAAEKLNDLIAARRALHIVRIVQSDPSQLSFLMGWTRRALSFLSCMEEQP